MDISNAVNYIFEDQNWFGKLATLFLVLLFAAIPLFGLLILAVAMGYMLLIVNNVRNGHPRPLPKWQDIGMMFNLGGYFILALIVYYAPIILINLCFGTILGSIFGDFFTFVLSCVLIPFNFMYSLIAWPLLGAAAGKFSETRDPADLFRVTKHWRRLNRHRGETIQWMVLTLLVNFCFGLLFLIPCLGWVVVPMFSLPVQAHLLGQFARQLDIAPPQKRKPGGAF